MDIPQNSKTINSGGAAAEISSQERTALYLLIVSAFVVILNETLLGVAITPLRETLGITASSAQWLTTAFMLTMATIIPTTGFILQRFSTRQIFLSAMTLFLVGTILSAASPNFALLLVGRIIQASGTAIMMPLLMTTAMTIVPPAQRGRVMGNISIVISVAPALGPTVSGAILAFASWRFLFITMIPIALLSLFLGWKFIENINEPKHSKIDLLSVVLSAMAFGGLVWGLTELSTLLGGGGAHGDGAVETGGSTVVAAPSALLSITIVVTALAAISLVVFVLRQLQLQKRNAALLDLRTFKHPNFTLSIVLMAVMMIALFGISILLPIFLQEVKQLSTLQVGMMLLPGGLVMGLAAPIVGRLFDKVGPRPLVIPGTIIVTLALAAYIFLSAATPVWLIVAIHVVLSIGLALIFTPVFTTAMASVPGYLYSYGSAIIGTSQQLFGAAGTALMVAIMTLVSQAQMNGGARLPDALTTGTVAAIGLAAVLAALCVGIASFVRQAQPQEVDTESAPAAEFEI